MLSTMLTERRNELGISLRELSEKTGLSHTFIRDIEKEKYAPSLENAVKLAAALELDIQRVVVSTFQFHQRLALLDLIKVCHEHGVEIPYEQWVQSSLPIQSLGLSSSIVHDAAKQIALKIYSDGHALSAEKKLALFEAISQGVYADVVYDVLPTIADTVNVMGRVFGHSEATQRVDSFLKEMNEQIKAQQQLPKEDIVHDE